MNKVFLFAIILFCICLPATMIILSFPDSARADTTRYVKEGGTGDGTSWLTASGTPQAMIDAVKGAGGGEVWIASGTYTPSVEAGGSGDRYRTFQMKNAVEIYGGFPATGSPAWADRDWETYQTILSGEIGNAGTKADNCYHVFYHPTGTFLLLSAVLDGFTITGGFADGSGYHDDGAGMHNYASSPKINNCIFRDNSADWDGGGIYNDCCSPYITDCLFSQNSAGNFGGGIRNGNGGFSGYITNCVFSGNQAVWDGGGMYNYYSSSDVTNCIFIGNSAGYGGGINNYDCSPDITNCTFSSNTASLYAGGMYNYFSDPAITNCILWGDTADFLGNELYHQGVSPIVTYSNVGGGTGESWFGTGCMDIDPMWVNPGSEDIHLMSVSPCIDSGTDSAPSLPVTDFEGDSRIQGRVTDMGADETPYYPPIVITGSAISITTHSATLCGMMDDPGEAGTVIISFQYGTDEGGPYAYESGTQSISGTGSFSQGIDNLNDEEIYYYRVKAVGDGTAYGSEQQFATMELAEHWYVNSGTGTGGNGSSWAQAFDDLQKALDVADSLDQIWVASGTYMPTTEVGGTGSRYRTFQMKNAVEFYGGFPATGSPSWADRDWENNLTVLSGDIGTPCYSPDNCYHVFYHPIDLDLDSTAVLDGFTIGYGYANGASPHYYGAGMYNRYCSPTITNCIFSNNISTYHGGGMYNDNSCSTITNCAFIENYADGNFTQSSCGGGMYNTVSPLVIIESAFSGNQAKGNNSGKGGAMYNYYSSGTITGCVFENNEALGGNDGNSYGEGGAIINSNSSPVVVDCTFTENEARGDTSGDGGGICNWDDSNPKITSCIFSGNISSKQGGAIFTSSSLPVFASCVFSFNASANGGGIYNNDSITLTNCTLFGNHASFHGGGMYNDNWNDTCDPIITNCIFWGNTSVHSGDEIYNLSNPEPVITYCDIDQDGYEGIDGNIRGTPMFANSGSEDYHLLASSPCLDAGTNSAPNLPDEDYEGDNRITGGAVDMGADESPFYPPVVVTGSATVITVNSGTLNGILQDMGGSGTVVVSFEYGIVWGGPYPFSTGTQVISGTGNFAILADGLNDGCKYYFRAIAQGGGTGYGQEESFTTVAIPQIWYVNAGTGTGGNGSSWSQAFDGLQDALDAAFASDEIRVAAGTYKPTSEVGGSGDAFKAFQMKNGLGIYGGFPDSGSPSWNDRDWVADATILSGDLDANGRDFGDSYHVFHNPVGMRIDTSAILDGFTIRNGYAAGSDPHDRGAGIFNDGASPTITNCTFFLNDAGNYGGGIYNTNASNPVIAYCTFDSNYGLSNGGGGISNYMNCSPTIHNCLFTDNHTAGSGGGIDNLWYSHPTISNCTFDSNTASNYAGGMYNSFYCAPVVTNCTFFGNTGAWDGGSFGSYSSSPQVTNCILWGSEQNENYIGGPTGTPSFTYCDIQMNPGSPPYQGIGNIKGTPVFTNPGSGDFHLKLDSPCIDSGSNAAAAGIATDFEGDQRIIDGDNILGAVVDMGIDEFCRIYYVRAPEAGPYGNGNGTSWENACDNLQDALAIVKKGNEIWVASGTYTPVFSGQPGTRTDTFQLVDGAEMYGGFAGTETAREQRNWNLNITTLCGDLDGFGRDINDSYHVVYANGIGSDTILDGFRITGGNASDTSEPLGMFSGEKSNRRVSAPDQMGLDPVPAGAPAPPEYNFDGAGMLNIGGAAPTIRNCDFRQNYAASYGGGMYNFGTPTPSNPVIIDCVFSGNTGVSGGGGIHNYYCSPSISDSQFTGNQGGIGAGMYNIYGSSPTIDNCCFIANVASGYGGGMENEGNSSPVITHTTFFDNNGASYGGGMENYVSSNPIIDSCVFTGNSATEGGGMSIVYDSNPIITNCTFSSNNAGSEGGGAYVYSSNPVMTNCTFYENIASLTNGGGMLVNGGTVVTTNCILWENTPDEIVVSSGMISTTYCDIQVNPGSPVYAGTGNISADPLWVDPGSGDFHLLSNSPCIDSGSNGAVAGIAHDFEGDDRVIDGDATPGAIVDIGIDEYLPPPGVMVKLYVNLQGSNRPSPEGWQVPLNIGFYPQGSPNNWLLNPGSAIYYFPGTATAEWINGGTKATVTVGPVNSGTYDITADSSTTLLNVKRSVHIP